MGFIGTLTYFVFISLFLEFNDIFSLSIILLFFIGLFLD